MTVLCVGEAIVDLICEKPIASIEEADSFRPHPGGALANVAVAASHAGADVALAGGIGEDGWGRWLDARLAAEGVDLRWFAPVPRLRTPLAFVTFDHHGEPSFLIYGEGIEAGLRSLRGRLDEAVAAARALVFGSNTLVGGEERRVTLEARRIANRGGVPVLFDPNLRPQRWGRSDLAIRLCRQMCDGAFLVRCNREEAAKISGEADPRQAAAALADLGAELAVVTQGGAPVIMRGAAAAEVEPPKVDVVSPLGAGDAFMGTLTAGLARLEWDGSRAAEALPAAAEAGARACTHLGAQP